MYCFHFIPIGIRVDWYFYTLLLFLIGCLLSFLGVFMVSFGEMGVLWVAETPFFLSRACVFFRARADMNLSFLSSKT
jgi:hypothetical protein